MLMEAISSVFGGSASSTWLLRRRRMKGAMRLRIFLARALDCREEEERRGDEK